MTGSGARFEETGKAKLVLTSKGWQVIPNPTTVEKLDLDLANAINVQQLQMMGIRMKVWPVDTWTRAERISSPRYKALLEARKNAEQRKKTFEEMHWPLNVAGKRVYVGDLFGASSQRLHQYQIDDQQKYFENLDRNKDGVLKGREAKSFLNFPDYNEDQSLSREELDRWLLESFETKTKRENYRKTAEKRMLQEDSVDVRGSLYSSISNGYLGPDISNFSAADRNGDGRLNSSEASVAGMEGHRDYDRDGMLTFDEVKNSMKERFNHYKGMLDCAVGPWKNIHRIENEKILPNWIEE